MNPHRKRLLTIGSASAAAGAALWGALRGTAAAEELEPEVVEQDEAPRWGDVPEQHILRMKGARGAKRVIDCGDAPCTLWIELPPGREYTVTKVGSAGALIEMHHVREDAVWFPCRVYRSGFMKLTVRTYGGGYVTHFDVDVKNVGRGNRKVG